ncbi:MAG: tetratricopeptide repeat-containing glycosyltransferase family 2 protein [Lachnospiraceae bacterium]
MKGRPRIRISQCMIVKNEENNIERALSWGRELMFEQIVVDTGSTDRTVALAKQLGAKVLHFQWTDDFSAAKNYAIEKAQGDWIVFLDADEYFTADHAKKIPSFLNQLHNSKYLGLISQLLNFDDHGKFFCGGTQLRIFRNLPLLQYRGSIHESLENNGNSLQAFEMVDASEELAVYHDGYKQSVAGKGQKGRRNRPLILKELEKNPGSSELMGYLADCYATEKEHTLAIEWYEKAVAAMEDVYYEYHMRASATFANLLMLLSRKKADTRMLEIYQRAIRALPKDADFDYIVGKHYVHHGNYEKGAYHLERAFELLEQFGDNNRAAHLMGDLPGTWELLALCFFYSNEQNKCVNCCIKLLKAQPYIMATLVILLSVFQKNQPAEEVVQFLGRLYDFNSLKDRIFVLKASMQAGYHKVTAILRGLLTPAEQDSFDRAIAGNSSVPKG